MKMSNSRTLALSFLRINTHPFSPTASRVILKWGNIHPEEPNAGSGEGANALAITMICVLPELQEHKQVHSECVHSNALMCIHGLSFLNYIQKS